MNFSNILDTLIINNNDCFYFISLNEIFYDCKQNDKLIFFKSWGELYLQIKTLKPRYKTTIAA